MFQCGEKVLHNKTKSYIKTPTDMSVGTLGWPAKAMWNNLCDRPRYHLTAFLGLSLVGARDVSVYSKGAAHVEGESLYSGKALSDKHAHRWFYIQSR